MVDSRSAGTIVIGDVVSVEVGQTAVTSGCPAEASQVLVERRRRARACAVLAAASHGVNNMSVVDDPKTFGRTRLSFANTHDIDEFVATLERSSAARSRPISGGAFDWYAAPTVSVRPPTRKCSA